MVKCTNSLLKKLQENDLPRNLQSSDSLKHLRLLLLLCGFQTSVQLDNNGQCFGHQ